MKFTHTVGWCPGHDEPTNECPINKDTPQSNTDWPSTLQQIELLYLKGKHEGLAWSEAEPIISQLLEAEKKRWREEEGDSSWGIHLLLKEVSKHQSAFISTQWVKERLDAVLQKLS